MLAHLRFAVALAALMFLAGCSGKTPTMLDDGHDHGGEHDMAKEPRMVMMDGALVLSASAGGRTSNVMGNYSYPITVGPNTTGFIVEISWTPASPLAEKLAVWIRAPVDGTSADALMNPPTPVSKVTGLSPIKLVLPASSFGAGGDFEVLVRAAEDGIAAAAQQPFNLHILIFDGLPFDPEYDPEGHGHGG